MVSGKTWREIIFNVINIVQVWVFLFLQSWFQMRDLVTCTCAKSLRGKQKLIHFLPLRHLKIFCHNSTDVISCDHDHLRFRSHWTCFSCFHHVFFFFCAKYEVFLMFRKKTMLNPKNDLTSLFLSLTHTHTHKSFEWFPVQESILKIWVLNKI